MATRLYLRALVPAAAPPANTKKSAALPVGTLHNQMQGELSLRLTKGPSQLLGTFSSLPQIVHQDEYLLRFSTPGLSAATIAANTWTIGLASFGEAPANSYTALSLYVWRPSTSAVVGYIYDSDTPLGVEWPPTFGGFGQVYTIAGAAVVANASDLLVLEVWRHAVQDAVAVYSNTIYLEGTTDVTAGGNADHASYIETPQTLSFGATAPSYSGTIDVTFPAFTMSASGGAIGPVHGNIAATFPAFAATILAYNTLVPPPVPVNRGYAYTEDQLESSILANTCHTDCPLVHVHVNEPDDFHKEPYHPTLPGSPAVTFVQRVIIHEKDPAGIYYTTVVGVPP